jgi:peptidylprolyl isomerase
MKIEKGNKVKVDYEGKFESGEIFDSSSHGDHSHPLEFEVGKGDVIKGFDNALIGMSVGEEKTFTIKPSEAYGEVDQKMMKNFPRKVLPKLPNDEEPTEGMTLILSSSTGQKFPARIAKVTKENVTLDLNHPLAGKTLIFKIKVIEIN